MAADISAKIGMEGEGTFKSSLKAINSQLKNLGSEMKSVVAAFTGMENSEEAVAKRGDVLQRSIAASNEKLKLLQNYSEKAKEKLEKLGVNVEKTQQQMEAASAALEDAKSKFAENSEEVKKAEEEWRKAADSARRAQNAYNDQVSAINQLGVQMNQTTAEIARMEREMAELGDSAEETSDDFDEVEQSSINLKSAITAVLAAVAAATAALVGLGAKAVSVGSEFEASMSQVAATMGLTVAEIQGGSAAYETLSEAAKNAGATTKFTATEAAQALNYLALAGYDAATSAEVLPSVLNLAAAGGMDLANASDLATDAMAALGIEANAQNLTRFGDEMAKASSKANYSVAQLGEAILTVGGTAKNLAGGTVELNTALGVLANRGIKAAEGGTALRNIILALSAPTDKAAKLMDSLGLSVYDAEGNLRPLNETFSDLNAIMKDMSSEERTSIISEIFNARDLKSAEALLAGCGEEFDALATAIKNSGGAMQEMADVQMDNLKGSMTILGSGLEGVGIQVYEKFEKPLKKAARAANDAVGEVARSLRGGKLSQSMDGLAESVGELMESAVELAQKALPKMIDGLALVVGHAGEIKTVLLGAASAMAAFKTASIVNSAIEGWPKAVEAATKYKNAITAVVNAENIRKAALAAQQVVVGLLTGKISLLTAAQAAYNAVLALCPIGLLVTGAAALVVVLGTLLSSMEKESEAAREFRKRLDELRGSIDEQAEAKQRMQEASQESINQSLSEMDYTEKLIAQLDDLTDANGKVKDGYENRARALAEQINSVIPDAIRLTEKEGQTYVKTAEDLEMLMAKKRVNAILNAKEAEYTAAIESQTKTIKNLLSLQEEMAAKKEELTALQEAYNASLLNGSLGEQNTDALAVRQAQADLETMEGLFQQQAEMRKENFETIDEYNRYLELSYSESAEAIEAGLNDIIYQQGTFNDESRNKMDEHLKLVSDTFALELEQAKQAGYDIGEAELNGLLSGKDAFLQAVQEYAAAGREIPAELMVGVNENAELFAEALVAMKDNGLMELDKAKAEMEDLAKHCTEGFANGLLSKDAIDKVVNSARSLGEKALSTVKGFFKIASPSKVMRDEVGEMLSEGVAVGIEKGESKVEQAAAEMAKNAVAAAEGIGGIVPFAQRTAAKVGGVLEKEAKALNGRLEEIQSQATAEQAEAERKQYEENVQKKYKELEKVEKAGKQKILDEIAKLEADWNKKQEEAALKDRIAALQAFQKEYESAVSEIEKSQGSLQSKLEGYGSLFERVKTEEGKELFKLGDIESEIQKLEKYGEAIERLRGRGISDGLVGEIAGMGVDDALKYMDELISLSDEKFEQYVSLFRKKQQTAQDVAEKFYKDEFNALEQEYTERLPEALDGVKAQMYEAGAEAAESLKEGLAADGKGFGQVVTQAVSSAVVGANDATQEQNFLTITEGMTEQEPILTGYIEELKERLIALIESYRNDFVNVGNMMMAGVAQGIEEGRSGVVNAVAAVIAAAVARARSDLDINSPSKVFQEIGGYMASGLDVGWTEKMRGINRSISNSLASIAAPPEMAAASGAAGGRSYTYGDINLYIDTVNNANGRDVQRLATELEFYRRQQAAGRGG